MPKEESEFIENLKQGPVNTKFAVADKIIRTSKRGNPYLQVVLSDKTGQIVCRMFDNSAEEVHNTLEIGEVYRVRGEVQEYPHGSGNLNIKADDFMTGDQYALNDYVRVTPHSRVEMMDEILKTITGMTDPILKPLLESFFCDKKFREDFMTCPSAKMYHHNYIGGLLEHTLGVLRICKTATMIHHELDVDLLYAGAIFHDFGKLEAYDYNMVAIELTQTEKLLGHISVGSLMVDARAADLMSAPVDENDPITEEVYIARIRELKHLILSHHGVVMNGWGSPVDPKTPEAVALHHADNLDAKVKGFIQEVK
jgi:3'-5' exoribonuclease